MLRLAPLVPALAFAAASVWFVLTNYLRLPFWDYWDWLANYYAHGFVSAALTMSNEHRPVFPALLFGLDATVGQARGLLLTAAGLALQFAGFAGLLLPLRGAAIVPRREKLLLASVAIVSAGWFIQGENLFWPINAQIFLCNAAMVASAWGFSRRAEGRRWIALCIAGGAVSGLSFAHGMLIWPAMVLALVRKRERAGRVAIPLAASAAALLYAWGYRTPPHHADPWQSLHKPVEVAGYVVSYFGNVFRRALPAPFDPDRIAGIVAALGLCLVVAAILHYLWRRDSERAEDFYIPLLSTGLAAGLVTALGRITLEPGQALSQRYITVQLLFWTGAAILGTIRLHRWGIGSGGRALWTAAAVLWPLSMIPSHLFQGEAWAAAGRINRHQEIAISIGLEDEEMWKKHLHPHAPTIRAALAGMRSARKGPFADGGPEQVGSLLRRPAEATCLGEVGPAAVIRGPGGEGRRYRGWIAGRSGEPVRVVVVAERSRTIEGLGWTGHEATASEASRWSGFTAYVRPGAEARLEVLGVPDSGAPCSLGRGSP